MGEGGGINTPTTLFVIFPLLHNQQPLSLRVQVNSITGFCVGCFLFSFFLFGYLTPPPCNLPPNVMMPPPPHGGAGRS